MCVTELQCVGIRRRKNADVAVAWNTIFQCLSLYMYLCICRCPCNMKTYNLVPILYALFLSVQKSSRRGNISKPHIVEKSSKNCIIVLSYETIFECFLTICFLQNLDIFPYQEKRDSQKTGLKAKITKPLKFFRQQQNGQKTQQITYVCTILFSKGVVVISTATHVSMLKISDNVYQISDPCS